MGLLLPFVILTFILAICWIVFLIVWQSDTSTRNWSKWTFVGFVIAFGVFLIATICIGVYGKKPNTSSQPPQGTTVVTVSETKTMM